jgi:hypothetical protein
LEQGQQHRLALALKAQQEAHQQLGVGASYRSFRSNDGNWDDRPRPGKEPTITPEAKAWLVSIRPRSTAIRTSCGRRGCGRAMRARTHRPRGTNVWPIWPLMGRLNHDQRQLFYSFRLEDAVPDDHLVRAIAGVLDLSWVHAELAPYYPKLGRPSIDPVLMIRMLAFAKLYARDGRPSVASCGRCRLLDTRSHDDHWTKRRHPETAHDTVSSHDCTVR